MKTTTTTNSRKLKFSRTDSHKKKRLGTKWRKPKGLHNKMRLRARGYAPVVKKGYRSPAKTRGLSKSGMKIATINKVTDLQSLDQSTLIVVSSTIGNKKRIEILEEAKKLKLNVINHSDSKASQIKEEFEKRRKAKQAAIKEAEEKAKKKEKKSIEESVKKEEETEEETKDKEKKDYDKLLTTKK